MSIWILEEECQEHSLRVRGQGERKSFNSDYFSFQGNLVKHSLYLFLWVFPSSREKKILREINAVFNLRLSWLFYLFFILFIFLLVLVARVAVVIHEWSLNYINILNIYPLYREFLYSFKYLSFEYYFFFNINKRII